VTIIRQKLAQIAKGEGAVEKAWRIAVSRAARDTVGIDLAVSDLEAALEVPALAGLVPEHALIFALLRGQEDHGVAILSPSLSSALVEMQMTGRIARALPSRPPTQTDATLCHDMVQASLSAFDQLVEESEDWAKGFGIARSLPNADAIAQILPDSAMRRMSISVILNGGARTGVLTLLLPAAQPKLLVAGSAETEFQAALSHQIMTAEAILNAVLCHVTISLGAVMALKAGDTIPLPQATIDQVRIETADGKLVSQGQLGQNRGMRALRVGGEAARKADIAPLRQAG